MRVGSLVFALACAPSCAAFGSAGAPPASCDPARRARCMHGPCLPRRGATSGLRLSAAPAGEGRSLLPAAVFDEW